MEVILTKEVPNLGHPGSFVSVKNGYARNYLFPKSLAVPKTKTGLVLLEKQKEVIQNQVDEKNAEYTKLVENIGTMDPLEITAKAGAGDKLFGAITTANIAEELKSQKNIELDKRQITLKEKIKALGAFTVNVQLSKEHKAKLHLTIVPGNN